MQPPGERAVLLVFAALLAGLVAMQLLYVTRLGADVLYMDSLRLLIQIEEWRRGEISLARLWGLDGSQHRGLLFHGVLMANAQLTGLDVATANRATALVLGAFAGITGWTFLRSTAVAAAGSAAQALRLLVAACIAGICFSLAGYEVLTLEMGLALWLKNLLFVLYFLLHERVLRDGRAGWSAVAMLAGPAIVLLVAMGWSYAFAAAVAGVHVLVILFDRQGRRFAQWLPTAVLLGTLVLYATSRNATGQSAMGTEALQAGMLLKGLALVPHAVGSAVVSSDAARAYGLGTSLLPLAGYLLLAAAAWGLFVRTRRGLLSGSLLPLYMIAYGSVFALSVCIVRGDAGADFVAASRYYMDLLMLPIGVLWLLAEQALVSRGRSAKAASSLASSLLLATLLLSLAGTQWREWKYLLPQRALGFEAMRAATLAGVPDQNSADMLQSPLPHARGGVDILRRKGWSLFMHVPASQRLVECERPVMQGPGWHALEASGTWMAQQATLELPACTCAHELDVYIPPGFSTRQLSVSGGAFADGKSFALEPGVAVSIDFPASSTPVTYALATSAVTVPARDVPGAGDARELAAQWFYSRIDCVPASAAP